MPIHHALPGPPGIIHTVLSGRVNDEELLAYYAQLIPQHVSGPWREIVDGRQITDMAISQEGLSRLAGLIAGHLRTLRDVKVAMVAASDVTYGMFRMWEIRREALGYPLQVFRRADEALAWLTADGREETA